MTVGEHVRTTELCKSVVTMCTSWYDCGNHTLASDVMRRVDMFN